VHGLQHLDARSIQIVHRSFAERVSLHRVYGGKLARKFRFDSWLISYSRYKAECLFHVTFNRINAASSSCSVCVRFTKITTYNFGFSFLTSYVICCRKKENTFTNKQQLIGLKKRPSTTFTSRRMQTSMQEFLRFGQTT
jgi:hypothetical protein